MPPIHQRQKHELCSQGELPKSQTEKVHEPFLVPKIDPRNDRFVSRRDARQFWPAEKTKSGDQIQKASVRLPAAKIKKSARVRPRNGITKVASEKSSLRKSHQACWPVLHCDSRLRATYAGSWLRAQPIDSAVA